MKKIRDCFKKVSSAVLKSAKFAEVRICSVNNLILSKSKFHCFHILSFSFILELIFLNIKEQHPIFLQHSFRCDCMTLE